MKRAERALLTYDYAKSSRLEDALAEYLEPVSYTHLTLPTKA